MIQDTSLSTPKTAACRSLIGIGLGIRSICVTRCGYHDRADGNPAYLDQVGNCDLDYDTVVNNRRHRGGIDNDPRYAMPAHAALVSWLDIFGRYRTLRYFYLYLMGILLKN